MRKATVASPWTLSARDFPHNDSPAAKLKFALRYAVLAPSSHNTQPWLFRIRRNGVELLADRSRSLPVVDPDDRELIMSCGAALFHLRLALAHFCYLGEVNLLPDPLEPDLLARVTLGYSGARSVTENLMFHAIPKRRTNRLPFSSEPVPETLLGALQSSAWTEHAWLHVVRGDFDRCRLAALVAQGDRRQWSNKKFRAELSQWVRPNRSRSRDGIPGYAQGIDDLLSYAGPLVVRTFDMGEGQAARDYEVASGSPALIVLGTPGDTIPDWIAAGQALARVLLRARAEDVWASFLNQPIEIPALRIHLRELTGRLGHPQTVLRLGYGQDIRPTPRRSLDEVLI